jgi:hypothetical protein
VEDAVMMMQDTRPKDKEHQVHYILQKLPFNHIHHFFSALLLKSLTPKPPCNIACGFAPASRRADAAPPPTLRAFGRTAKAHGVAAQGMDNAY